MTAPLPARKYLVRALERTADLLDILGEEEFKSRAYRGAARSLETLPEETPELLAKDFAGIPRVGKGIAAELSEFARTGSFAPLDAAAAQLPPGLLELLDVRGLGPKKIRSLWLSGIDSLERLREAAQGGELAALKGFGAKSAAGILENVEFLLEARTRQRLDAGLHAAEALVSRLADLDARVSGDVRRGLDTVRVARVTVTGTPEAVTERLSGVVEELERVPERPVLAGRLDGVPVEVAFVPEEARGTLDLLMGGSGAYRQELIDAAQARGLELRSRGLLRGGQVVPAPTEADVARHLGVTLRPAEYREPEHDGLWSALPAPEDLLQVSDLRGMIHTHSTWSDGGASIEEMARETLRLGHEYLGTADHSRAAHYANGLSVERLRAQLKEVRELQRAGLPIVAGSEVDILDDGSLDFPDDVLAELDYVVASVHSGFTLDAERQTERLIRAASHPLVTVLGHPTGRLLLRRPGYALDVDAVLGACEAAGTVVELNANPARLDLDWRWVLRWRGRLTWAINTDAHVPAGLGDARYGVAVARKAGLTPAQVVNSLGRQAFLDFVARQRSARSSAAPAERA
ncbi:DNA polymerase/3'-5' exonuclease PolX [Deinococcus wulumuqiensis]|uniref:DNA-directed DNA polymerase n=1 Tax=Deinococcus wulumuqiensis TaxID=980427 RepID=A0AAV4K8E7_9DEIO|nr:DNA polymerase/3'-5' exonuclease PolX [Deinococcus wulumuqiensis]QII20931.1 DNA polymerase/3'-5' exonuclease PolX [Deinococcus wulumuqiensis R12]GGI93248.1 DNA polymerase/3'-5' exonuclease PolX [Deinococcus wulumuqiensis]GGP31241.1 DNA polymerase/3'-5' exonuclease PolX [Deinococcus wulumuqiensis]